LDTLCATLEEKMAFEEGERDLVVCIICHSLRIQALTLCVKFLQHKFEVENKDGSQNTVTSTLCEYGAPVGSGGFSAMERLVGVPCGVGKSAPVLNIALLEW
jgi:saccharopine dehydrogenase (NADP+, L-glutamate forming)